VLDMKGTVLKLISSLLVRHSTGLNI